MHMNKFNHYDGFISGSADSSDILFAMHMFHFDTYLGNRCTGIIMQIINHWHQSLYI